MIYFSIQDIQNKYNELYERNHSDSDFLPVLNHLLHEKKYLPDTSTISLPKNLDLANETDLARLLSYLYIEFPQEEIRLTTGGVFREYDFLSGRKDVAVLHSFAHAAFHLHLHSAFELNYVLKGKCLLHFENETRQLETGDLVIISPNSLHEFEKRGCISHPRNYNGKNFPADFLFPAEQ